MSDEGSCQSNYHVQDGVWLDSRSSTDQADDERQPVSRSVEEMLLVLRMTLHPTFVPFTPWTTLEGYLDLLNVLQEQALIENVAPIQLGIPLT